MEKHYYLKRFLRSMLSVLLIMVIVFIMVFSLIPRDNIFFQDTAIAKLRSKPDQLLEYKLDKWQRLGYLEYHTLGNYCALRYEIGSAEIMECAAGNTSDKDEFIAEYTAKNFTVQTLVESKNPIAYRDLPMVQRIFTWLKKIIVIDNPWAVKDANNTELKRNISVGTTPTGGLAIKCSGCTHKYLLYTDTDFPFIHQNIIGFDLGQSYPQYSGLDVLTVIFQEQGSGVQRDVTYETGSTGSSAINFGTCKYKPTLDKMEMSKFSDHYADCASHKDTPSMVATSFIMGIFALILAYGIGLPVGLAMAKGKEGLVDKLGMVYIIFIISVPSLAYICIFRYIGTKFIGLPTVFSTYGPSDIRSWILPVISLALPSIASLMLWTRRYVADQMNSDYVKFARAKGLNEREIFYDHVLKNASIPIVHGIPSSLAGCITGAIITEKFYAVGGMGKMLPDAITNYNNSMIVALTFMFSSISVLSVFAGDVLLTWVDPRIQLAEKEGRS